MITTERHYCVSEAAFLLRLLLGPEFGNLYTVLADQRRGRITSLPFIRFYMKGFTPYYLSSDLMGFVELVRSMPELRTKAKRGAKPVFHEIDIEKEISL